MKSRGPVLMSKKALLVTTVSGFVPQFEMNNVHILQSMGFEVHYAANYHTPSYGDDNHRLDGTGIVRHQIDFVRSPFRLDNLTAYRQLKQLMREHQFQLIHCHTPMGSVLTRLAAHRTNTRPVIYTAHGFHFYSGAPLKNWLFYYPVEKFLSRYTDQQICINHEDYRRASAKFHSTYTDYIPGAGIDLNRIRQTESIDPTQKKRQLKLPLNRIILLSSGELIKRKNHETVLRALAKLREYRDDFQYVICGHGELNDYLRHLAEDLNITDHVTFLGYRTDILEICRAADLFIFPSFQEGLPMALLEAMASGLPVLCSDIRGNNDLMEPLISEGALTSCAGGIMVRKADDADAYCQALIRLLSEREKLKEMGGANKTRAEAFSSELVTEKMQGIYERLMKNQIQR